MIKQILLTNTIEMCQNIKENMCADTIVYWSLSRESSVTLFLSLKRLRSKVKPQSLVVASYDIVRNDGDFFRLVVENCSVKLHSLSRLCNIGYSISGALSPRV